MLESRNWRSTIETEEKRKQFYWCLSLTKKQLVTSSNAINL